MNKVNISIFQHTKLNIGAGEERAILNYAKHFSRDSFNLTIFETDYCPVSNLSDPEIKATLNGVRLVTIKSIFSSFKMEDSFLLEKGIVSKRIGKIFYLFLKVFMNPIYSSMCNRKKLAELKNSDLIFSYDAEYLPFLSSVPKSVPIVATFRRDFTDMSNISKRSILKRFSLTLQKVIYYFVTKRANSFHFLTQRLYSNSPIHRKGDFILNSGTDIKMFHPQIGVRNGNFKFIFVARLEKIKGIVETVDAFESLDQSDIELYIIGSGPMEQYVTAKAKADHRIHYCGYLTKEELAKMYRMCDALVFPTKMSEQHPLIVVEAIASGLTVLTSDKLRGIFDFFERNGALKYLNEVPNNLPKAMLELMNKKEYLRDNSSNISLMASRYSWEIITQKLFVQLANHANL